jgi:hypothetical protein
MKDNMGEHFEYVHHNVSTNDMNQGTMEYANLGKVGLNNCVGLSHNNILQRAHQLAHFCMKKYLGVTLAVTPFHMCKSGQFYPDPTWVIPLRLASIDVRKTASIWKTAMSPHDIDMENIFNVFFNTMLGSQTCYTLSLKS